MTWLSLLIPVFNVADYVEECVRSVLEQADAGVQVLLLDDCSTDASWAVLQRLAQQWPGRLQLLQHACNSGISAARNSLLAAAQGDYVWFLDSDDKVLPGALAQLRQIVQSQQPDLVLCDFQVWRARPRLKHRLRREQHKRSFAGAAGRLVDDRCALLHGLLLSGQLHAWSKIARRALWSPPEPAQALLRFPVGRYFEDMVTMPLLALRAQRFYYQSTPWMAYRQRGGSILASMTVAKALDQSTALLPLRQALTASGCAAHAGVQRALAQHAARNWQGASRFIARADLPLEEKRRLLTQVRSDFEAVAGVAPAQWLQSLLLRGRWIKAAKFWRAYRAAMG